ncbi:MAG: ethanolamine ammonia-lyase subunit EutC [Rhodocyclaceae bacterium]|nr:ethanolamine ammonia-lyase subunit EutC [Rhodocyclaceae bacterium]
MEQTVSDPVQSDAWSELRRYTRARIALGRAGNSLPTAEVLKFSLAHAQARDAVHLALPRDQLLAALAAAGHAALAVHSAAADRAQYLRRPDWGRKLDDASRASLLAARPAEPPDVVFVIADGLSATASAHAEPLLQILLTRLQGWRVGPIVVAEQARVALGDDIGALLGARQVVMLIGERPGLSSPDSLGIYLTYAPRPGRTDAERNCISNVRPEGLGYEHAAHTLHFLLAGARRLGLSGIGLKDDSGLTAPLASAALPE